MPGPSPARASSLLRLRLAAQLLGPHDRRTPAEVVGWMGAVQAQDLGASRWAVGVRLPGSTDAGVGQAISEGQLLRVHLFRGTWQLVAPADVRWMLALVGPRVLAPRAARERQLGLDARLLRRALRLIERALAGGRHRTRAELAEALSLGGVRVAGLALAHVIQRAELSGLVASGALRGRTPTFALLDERAPPGPRLDRTDALRELALRYARARGPVTAEDLAWWSGLTLRDARQGLESARPALAAARIEGKVCWLATGGALPAPGRGAVLLPAFDEYLVGYRDRRAALAEEHARRVNEGAGMLAPCLVVGGRVMGLWSRAPSAQAFEVELTLFEALAPPSRRSLAAAVHRYGQFMERPVHLGSSPGLANAL